VQVTDDSRPTRTQQPETPEAAGEVRQRLLQEGWQSDLGWAEVGSGSAIAAVRAAGEAEARRTIAYLASLRAVDRGAGRVWKEGNVAAPAEADAREVMLAEPNADDWRSEVFEAPVETVEDASPDNPDSTAPVDVA
jgi:hypothetical protein